MNNTPPIEDLRVYVAVAQKASFRAAAQELGVSPAYVTKRIGLLEQRLGCSISSFFEQHGEPAFRDHETALLAELAAESGDMVLSTGGGVVLRPENRAALRQGFSHVMYLRASPDEIYKRVRHSQTRPLLQVADPQARLRELYRTRDPLYREAAHYVIETGRPTVNTLVNMIVMQLEMAPGA